MMRALIVDDEVLARQRIADMLAESHDIEVVAECGNGLDAVERIVELRPDILFLDVQMPEMTGFDVLETVGVDAVPAIVFVTAFDEYALRAFDARAIDYLLKPFTSARFAETLERSRRLIGRDRSDSTYRDTLATLMPPPAERRIAARDGSRIVFLKLHEVDWIESSGNYIRIHAAGRTCTLRSTLRSAAERLHDAGFRRISHSVIVNADRVRAVERQRDGDYLLMLDDGSSHETTRSYADVVAALIEFP
jgi:two-component system, LytTR family, response regulator